MAENKKMPELRFKGFTDTWEQRKLGDYIRDSGDRTSDFEKYPLYSLTIENGVTPKTQRYERSFLVTKEDDLFKIVEPGNFVTNPMNLRFGAAGYNKEPFPVSVSGYYDVFEIDANQCSSFWNSYFRSSTGLEKFDDVATGSLLEKRRVHYSELKKAEFVIPRQLDERKAVGAFLERIEHLIDLHQGKYDRLLALKKAMLEKMFPKAGSNVPEVRFSGFAESWKQRKFSELYEKASEKNDLTYGENDIISVANMYFKKESYITDPEYLRTYNVFHIGDIAFEGNKSKNYAHGRFVENTIGDGIVSHVFEVFHPITDYDLLFWKYAINSELIMSSILVRCTKASTMMTNLVAGDFLQESILVPSIEEQRKIGSFLEQLNNLIALHQRNCEKLKNIKQSMLKKMFV